MRTIERTYEVWDEEALELGDTDDRGSDGVVWTDEGENDALEAAIKFLRREGVDEASCAPTWRPRTWYTSASEDYVDGTHTECSYHLSGFTEEEERAVYQAVMMAKGRP